MRVVVTRVAGDGTVRRAVVDVARGDDAVRWDELIERADLRIPPPYRPRPGEAVYLIAAGELAVQVAERDLTGPLRELVTAVLAEGREDWLPGLPHGCRRRQYWSGIVAGLLVGRGELDVAAGRVLS